MENNHLMDELNSKDTQISDLKYKLEITGKSLKENEFDMVILKKSNLELTDGI